MKFFALLQLKVLGRKIGLLLDNRFAPIGLTDTKAKILGALMRHEELTAKDLLPWTEVEKASLTEVLQGLEREGLIQRKPHPKDKRAILLSITEKGRAMQPKVVEALEKATEDLFSSFTEEEREEFQRLCKKLFARLEEMGIGWHGRGSEKRTD